MRISYQEGKRKKKFLTAVFECAKIHMQYGTPYN